ncbi:MAG: deoxynucleoside kinase [Anaerolineae bacterium]|nr:deoxynucleoside kinase [Anaerolineae bacterium]
MNTTLYRGCTYPYPYIAIEGVIGVGKTTLARMLSQRFGGETLLEAFDANPFLSNFYGDRARYAFQTQIFFLLSRYRQQQNADKYLQGGSLLSDYFFEKDKLFAHLNVTGDELVMYERLYEALSEKVRQPDLVVYLRAEIDTLMGRIAMRDRPYERQMDRNYISALRQGYEQLFAEYTLTPLLVIESDTVDFVRNPGDLDDIEHHVRAALAGVQQPRLPEIGSSISSRPAWSLPITPSKESHPEENWQALGDFLILAEAVGRIGGALAQHPPIGPEGAPQSFRNSLQDAARALTSLAQRTQISLEDEFRV